MCEYNELNDLDDFECENDLANLAGLDDFIEDCRDAAYDTESDLHTEFVDPEVVDNEFEGCVDDAYFELCQDEAARVTCKQFARQFLESKNIIPTTNNVEVIATELFCAWF